MKKGNIFAFSLIVSIILITLAPRFGFIWTTSETDLLRSTPENIRHISFYFAGTSLQDGYFLDTYRTRDGEAVTIRYARRFSRDLTAEYAGEPSYHFYASMDRGIKKYAADDYYDDMDNPPRPKLDSVLYCILSKDASGSLFFIYIRSVLIGAGVICLGTYYFDNRRKLGKVKNIFFLTILIASFVWYLLLSLRVL